MDNIPIFAENNSSFCLDITNTKDGKFITVNSNSRTSSEEGISLTNSFFSFQNLFCIFSPKFPCQSIWYLLQVYLIDANNPRDGLRCIRKRLPGVRYFLEHHNGFFYILTNAHFKEDKDMPSEDYYLAKCRFEEVFSSADWQVKSLAYHRI